MYQMLHEHVLYTNNGFFAFAYLPNGKYYTSMNRIPPLISQEMKRKIDIARANKHKTTAIVNVLWHDAKNGFCMSYPTLLAIFNANLNGFSIACHSLTS